MRKVASKSRKKLFIIAAVAVIAVGAIYTFLSFSQWGQVNNNTVASGQLLQSEKKIVFSSSTSVKERHEAINRLADMPQLKACTVGWWGDWQTAVVSSAETTRKRCEAMRTKQADVQRTAERTEVFLRDQKTIQSIVTKLTLGKTAISESDFAHHTKTAISVSKTLEKLSVHDTSRSLLEKAQKVTTAIAGAWKAVEDADKAENRERYEQSIDKLDQAYLRLNDVSDKAILVYSALLGDLEANLS